MEADATEEQCRMRRRRLLKIQEQLRSEVSQAQGPSDASEATLHLEHIERELAELPEVHQTPEEAPEPVVCIVTEGREVHARQATLCKALNKLPCHRLLELLAGEHTHAFSSGPFEGRLASAAQIEAHLLAPSQPKKKAGRGAAMRAVLSHGLGGYATQD
eukprot:TRINITY_DN35342_c0_g1_i1.p1 TRINITY_DN35342_c0_g1~~TRINITY_DN35342_c0_g1_i1.p1  ORF type:complete len:160 (+),score=44.45 TRINITY_DN35342_c0_g1_i1:114-593(+)